MSFLDIRNVSFRGVVASAPSQIFDNHNYEVIPSEQRQSFIDAIGVECHHIVSGETCTSDLCFNAAVILMQKIGWQPIDIDLLVFVSQTPDYKMPSTSCLLQNRLCIPRSCMAIDISQGCSGYIYGLGVAANLVSSGTLKKCLLLVGNTQSRNLNYRDKSTFPLFSDVGSATALEFDSNSNDRYLLSFGSDGSGGNTIIIPDGGYRHITTPNSFINHEYEGGIIRNNLNVEMHGDDVFAFVASNVPRFSSELFEHFQIDKSSIDYFLIHHASKFIMDKLIKKMQLPIEKVPNVLKDYGNSSNATIPLLLTTIHDGVCSKANKIYISGFGVGLSLGVGVIDIGPLQCAELIDYES